MAFGINAYNDANEVIISSELKNLHFIDKNSSPYSTVGSTLDFGARAILTYRVNNCPSIPVPFMYMPANRKAAITAVRQINSSTWDIEVVTNNHTVTLYIFADATSVQSDEGQGIVVYNADGSAAFDSRARPLAITDAGNVSPPSTPRTVFAPTNLDPKYCNSVGNSWHQDGFRPTSETNIPLSTSLPSKPMFFYFSLAQAELEAAFTASEEECDGGSVKGNCVGIVRRYFWQSNYWAFYRGTMSWSNSSNIQTNWVAVNWDCYWREEKDGGIIGIGTGGSSSAGGAFPYSNETINLAPGLIIAGDASRYD